MSCLSVLCSILWTQKATRVKRDMDDAGKYTAVRLIYGGEQSWKVKMKMLMMC